MKKGSPLYAGLLLLASASVVSADQPSRGDGAWRWTGEAGALYQSDTSVDTGGDMQVDRFFVEGGGSMSLASGWRLGMSLGYGEDRYDFSGSAGFGGLDPWGRIRDLRVSAPVQYALNDAWTLYGIPSLRFNAESGASLGDGQTAGLLAGAAYRVSDRLTIGPGMGVFSELEDDASIFPVLIIDWKISDQLSLETGRGFAASRGPGLQLRWAYSPSWQFVLGGRYEKTRFRLDDDGVAAGGVGEDRAVPLFAVAEYVFSPDTKLSMFGGARVGGSLRLEDASGRRVSESDLSNAPFLGASLQTRF
ncbi:MAG: TonB-dependent receptor [Chromatiaceae bacterium]|nr:TonB-dependent receptor [Chromatiaceae bacterium]